MTVEIQNEEKVRISSGVDRRTSRLPGPAPIDPVYRTSAPSTREVYETNRRQNRKAGF